MSRSPSSESSNLWRSLGLVGNLGLQIAVPLVGLAVAGRALDRRLGTSPWLLLGGILLSIIISSVLVTHRVIQAIKPPTPPPNHSNEHHPPKL